MSQISCQLKHEAAWCSTLCCLKHKREIQLGFRQSTALSAQSAELNGIKFSTPNFFVCFTSFIEGDEIAQRLEREFTDRLGQPGSIPALVLPSGGMAVRHRKGVTAEGIIKKINHAQRDSRALTSDSPC
ncbi:hypothetical protein CSKR_105029 [Clonorchis sinensis]|uniref:Uncharacterized protein n=1 Tax=Clonorchis sinensis TaxID=79923 RepID=A0A419PT56_CLOSI|nr:hypothetical protein CSKR_105029 [Clonorchis sinensis]